MQLQPFPADNPTTPQPSLSCPPFIHPYNHDSTALRVESKNDFDTTIHIRDSPTSTAKQRGRTAAHQSPLHAKCSLIRGRVRRMRSNAPQRFEASSWASCRTTAEASSFCESRAVRHICRTSSTQMSRSRVTFVTLPATPRPVPSKKRQRFTYEE